MGIFSTIFGGKALKQAARQNTREARNAQADELGYIAPYAQAGDNALKAYLDSIGQGDGNAAMAAFEASPAYKLNYGTAMDEGRRGVQDVSQAEGTYNSGRTLKALQDRAQETSRGFFSDYLKGLSGVADMGYNAAGANVGIRGQGAHGIMSGNNDYANAKVSQYQGIDSLLSANLKSFMKYAGGSMGGGGGGSIY